jgi:phage gp36-like protein
MYCTLSDIEARVARETLVRLADADGDGQPDSSIVEVAIQDADSEIDAYLGKRYVVPFVDAPQVVKALSAALALERLFARVPGLESREVGEQATESRRMLALLADGNVDISDNDGATVKHHLASTTEDEEREFSKERLGEF